MHISDLMSIDELDRAIKDGLVSRRKHPTHPIYILNYTAAAQFDWVWNDVTLNCRGLVIDEDYNIVARALPKFFTSEQLEGKLPEGNFVVEEKLDGSMLIAFNYNGELITATRGSFESEQAIKGKKFLPSYFIPHENLTWVFEVIYKANRVVVNYDFEGLVLLALVNKDGTEKQVTELMSVLGFRTPKIYSFESLEEILSYEEDNLEGFVLHYDSGERVKVKLEEYKRLHRLLTGVSEKTVWEAMRNGTLPALLENTPDEFYDWVTGIKEDLEERYQIIELSAKASFVDFGDRKKNAMWYLKQDYPAVMFHMLDGKDYSDLIWKMLRPEVTQVFKMVNESSN